MEAGAALSAVVGAAAIATARPSAIAGPSSGLAAAV